MELDAVNGKRLVSQPHYLILGRGGGDFENIGKRLPPHDEGMVPRRLERAWQPREDARAIVEDGGCLAVHEPVRADDFAAEHIPDALVAEAYAKDRRRLPEAPDDVVADARLPRRARPGRDADALGFHFRDLVRRDFVVPLDDHLRAQFPEVLHQVVGEGVVVIENEHHDTSPARSSARIIPIALFTVSWYSPSGVESATTPPPACTYARPSFNTTVRSAMQESRLPSNPK